MHTRLHIVMGDSAAGCLRCYLKSAESASQGEIIVFGDDLSVGPLPCTQNQDARDNWLFKVLDLAEDADHAEDFVRYVNEGYNRIHEIDGDVEITLWYGENASDLIARSYIYSQVDVSSIFEVNVSQSEILNSKDESYRPMALGECHPKEIGKLYKTSVKINKEILEDVREVWKGLCASKSLLRILEQGRLVHAGEDYFDNALLSHCGEDYLLAARVIGATMGDVPHWVSDTFLSYRLKKIIEKGSIVYRGELKSIRDYEVKIK